MRHKVVDAVVLGTVLALPVDALSAQAEELWATASNNLLESFSSESSGSGVVFHPVIGLAAGDTIVAIDFRPKPPLLRLYALANSGRLYVIDDPSSGVATLVTSAPFPDLMGQGFGFDFNPVEDRIRVVSDADQNLRLDPETGGVVMTDASLAYAAGDSNAGRDPMIIACAYSSNFDSASSTSLYAIDSDLDVLVVENPPNSGVLHTVGPLGVNVLGLIGFDISGPSGIGYAAIRHFAIPEPDLYTINLQTGAATSIGSIGSGSLHSLSVANMPTSVEPSTWGRIKQHYAR